MWSKVVESGTNCSGCGPKLNDQWAKVVQVGNPDKLSEFEFLLYFQPPDGKSRTEQKVSPETGQSQTECSAEITQHGRTTRDG